MTEELIRAACESANCKYPDMEAMANFKREVTPSVVIGLIDGLRHAKGIAAINDARANGAAETIQHLRDDIAELRAQLPSQVVEAVAWREHSVNYAKGEKCPETIETLQAAWGRDQELINDMRHEIARHKTRINRLEQRRPAGQVADGVAVSRKRLEHWADKLEDSESSGYGWEDALAAELRGWSSLGSPR